MRSQPPRDAIAATNLWVPVDATGADFYDLGSRFGTQVGVLHEVQVETGHPYANEEGTGLFDPRALRYHRLQRQTPMGDQDNRLTIQVLNDYEAEYQDARPGDAPFGQAEFFTALNRSTREADSKGRVALPSSHRRIIDSEDDRYALALTCRSIPLGTAELAEVPVEGGEAGEAPLPEGISINEAGTRSGTHGSVTTTQPSVSVGGVTFFGRAAVDAARSALRRGGSAADAARAASAAARGLPPPPLQDADGATREGVTADPVPEPPEPDRNAGGSVPLLNHPAGYVWSPAGRVGLLGTLVTPEGAGGSYFAGREGTAIGPLPLRHDAQVSMGPELVGRMVFVSNDAAEIDEGQGKPIKGELWADTTRANLDTELGLETTQWRPVIRVNADLPPSRPPPEDPPPFWPPEEEEDDEEEGKRKPGRGRGRGQPPGGGDPPEPTDPEGALGGVGGAIGVLPGDEVELLPPRRRESPGSRRGELGPVENPQSQVRDYEGPGVPCPNLTAGVFVATPGRTVEPGTRVGGLPVRPVPGGYIQYAGYPAVTPVPGGLLIGGEQAQGLSLGDPVVPGRRRRRQPAHGAGGAAEDPEEPEVSEIPVGLPTPPGPGFGFDPPLGEGRGIPRGAGERYERAMRRARAGRAREEAERREQERIDELEDLEERARAAGRERFARRVERARKRIEKRRTKREKRRRRMEEYKQRIREEREERQRRREERKAEKRRKREARRRRRNREHMARQDRGEGSSSPPQGGYFIPVTDLDESSRAALGSQHRLAAFGDWNVANTPLPFFGSENGPKSLEGWAQLATYQVRALQRVVNSAFGGPGYLAANLGIVQRGEEHPPSGSQVGIHWIVPRSAAERCVSAALEVISILDDHQHTLQKACGPVLKVRREQRGSVVNDDTRTLLLVDPGPTPELGAAIADTNGRFRILNTGEIYGTAICAEATDGQHGGTLHGAGLELRAGSLPVPEALGARSYVLWVSDGSTPGTKHGGLYLEGPAGRKRLDAGSDCRPTSLSPTSLR